MIEKTLVLIKPDAVSRNLIGKIISHFEDCELNVICMKMLTPTIELMEKHYPDSDDWFKEVGKKNATAYLKVGKNIVKDFNTENEIIIGKKVKQYMVKQIASGLTVAIVFEGNLAIQKARNICGFTFPSFADLYSIRGKYGCDSADIAYGNDRAVQNLVHSASSEIDAKREIELWFPEIFIK